MNGKSLKIGFVEYDIALRKALSEYLADHGHQIVANWQTTENVAADIKAMNDKPDVLIIDHDLQPSIGAAGMTGNGLSLAAQLKNEDIAVVVMTPMSIRSADVQKACPHAGYWPKDAHPENLLIAANYAVNAKQKANQQAIVASSGIGLLTDLGIYSHLRTGVEPGI